MGREIVTKGARFYCVSLQPDICKTPVGPTVRPVPYTVKGEFAEATGVSPDIRSNDEPVVIHASTVIPNVTGDEQGTAKGVKSGTVAKRVQHDQRSATVKFNGERAIRVGDRVFMNDKNTVGQVYERPGAPSHSAAGAAPARAPAGGGSKRAISGGDAGVAFGRRVQDLLGLARKVQSETTELAAGAGRSPAVALLAQALEKSPSLAGAGGADAAGEAAHRLLNMALKPLTTNHLPVHDLLPRLPPFISSALLNRIPGVPPIAAKAAVASGAAAHGHASPAPARGPAGDTAPGSAARSPSPSAGPGDGGSSRGRARSVAARTAAAPVQAAGTPVDEVRDKNGRLTPQGITEAGQVNYRMWNKKNIVYERSGNKESLEISGYVEDRGTGQGAAAVAAFNRAFTRTIEHDGNTLSVKTDMKVASDAKQIAGAAFVLKQCSDCEFTESYYVGGRASLGGFPDHVIFLAPRATAVTYGHEFGHILGLPHWHPYRDSIMAYDGIAKAGPVDVLRLFEIYRDPDAYWRRRQRQPK